jgi:transglutaminase-like putative cysteine protease/sugar lactone lactonase YvrE
MKTTTRSVPSIVSLAVTLAMPLAAGAAPGDVNTSFDAPCKYPAGMATDGKHLFVADWREAKIFQVNPADGEVVRTLDAPTLKPAGLTCAEAKLWVCDDHTGGVFALNVETGVVENTFEAPEKRATGLAHDDGVLFILAKGKVYRVMPEDGTILGYFDAPERSCRHLAHDGKYLWISDRIKDELYMVDPEAGKVIAIVKSPGPYPVGIAAFGEHLFNVDFQTRTVCRVVIQDTRKYALSETRRARVEYLWALNNYGPGDVTDLTLNVAVPMELPNQKLLSDVRYTQFTTAGTSFAEPRTVLDKWGQGCKVFTFGRVPTGTKATLTYWVNAEVSAISYLILPENTGTLDDIPPDIRAEYTADASRYRIDTPYMRETVKKIVGDEKNPYWIARKIYDFIIEHLEYQMVGGWDVPEVVLKRGSGSCSEYTYTFVALCRAAGLPARYQGSVVVRGDDASVDEAFHRWAQVYLPNYGWVPVDANRGDAKSPADQGRGFGGLSNRFLITTQSGGDSDYLNWSYNSFAAYKTTGYCKIEQDNFGFFEPLEPDQEKPRAGASETHPTG